VSATREQGWLVVRIEQQNSALSHGAEAWACALCPIFFPPRSTLPKRHQTERLGIAETAKLTRESRSGMTHHTNHANNHAEQ
jgi:hypothetical protein